MRIKKLIKSVAAHGSIIGFFIVAFEVMIMISPFAFFFYSVFNPIFQWLDKYPVTRWLTSFFLPHMILPPTIFLSTIRILGSLLFIIGLFTFIICALHIHAYPNLLVLLPLFLLLYSFVVLYAFVACLRCLPDTNHLHTTNRVG